MRFSLDFKLYSDLRENLKIYWRICIFSIFFMNTAQEPLQISEFCQVNAV